MRIHKPVCAATALVLTALAVTACGNDEYTNTPGPAVDPSITHTQWLAENFSSAPYLAQWASTNAQAYRPDNGDGLPLPTDAAKTDVVWQMPACIVIPYTGAGPRTSTVTGGTVEVSGWDHSEEGAVAAAHALFVTSGDSKNQVTAVSHATGLSTQDAERIIATTTQFATTTPSFNDSPAAQCSTNVSRPTAWKIVDYSTNFAVIDFFSPLSDDQTGAVIRTSVEWKDGDWKLTPATFAAFDSAISDLSGTNGRGRHVNIEEYAQW